LHRQQTEKDKQNVDFAKFLRTPMPSAEDMLTLQEI